MITEFIKVEGHMPLAQAVAAKFYNIMVYKKILTEEEALAEYEADRKKFGSEWV